MAEVSPVEGLFSTLSLQADVKPTAFPKAKLSWEIRDKILQLNDECGKGRLSIVSADDNLALRVPKEIVIGVYGDSGSGKSTLLNSIFGSELLLHGRLAACTTVATKVRRSSDGKFHLVLKFIDLSQWQVLLGSAHALLQAKIENEESDVDTFWKDGERDAFHFAYLVDPPPVELASEGLHDDIVAVLGKTVEFAFSSARELNTKLRDRAVTSNRVFWPFVEVVEISAPIDIPHNVVFCDASHERMRHTLSGLGGCEALILAHKADRAGTSAQIPLLLNKLDHKKCGFLVATKIDESMFVSVSELLSSCPDDAVRARLAASLKVPITDLHVLVDLAESVESLDVAATKLQELSGKEEESRAARAKCLQAVAARQNVSDALLAESVFQVSTALKHAVSNNANSKGKTTVHCVAGLNSVTASGPDRVQVPAKLRGVGTIETGLRSLFEALDGFVAAESQRINADAIRSLVQRLQSSLAQCGMPLEKEHMRKMGEHLLTAWELSHSDHPYPSPLQSTLDQLVLQAQQHLGVFYSCPYHTLRAAILNNGYFYGRSAFGPVDIVSMLYQVFVSFSPVAQFLTDLDQIHLLAFHPAQSVMSEPGYEEYRRGACERYGAFKLSSSEKIADFKRQLFSSVSVLINQLAPSLFAGAPMIGPGLRDSSVMHLQRPDVLGRIYFSALSYAYTSITSFQDSCRESALAFIHKEQDLIRHHFQLTTLSQEAERTEETAAAIKDLLQAVSVIRRGIEDHFVNDYDSVLPM